MKMHGSVVWIIVRVLMKYMISLNIRNLETDAVIVQPVGPSMQTEKSDAIQEHMRLGHPSIRIHSYIYSYI